MKYKGYEIQNAPFSEEIIDSDLKLCDEVRVLKSKKIKRLKQYIDDIEWDDDFEIVYIHRYPKDNEILIGVKRLKELTYFI